jgi:hypothetical protein
MLLVTGPPEDPVETFVEIFDLTLPVLNDLTWELAAASVGQSGQTPYYLLLGRDMTVLHRGAGPPSPELLDDALDQPWPVVDLPTSPCE